MTLTLGIDTATDLAVVALGDGQRVARVTAFGGRRHASSLVPTIRDLLRAAGATLGDVGRIVFADGPGSFTGLRIGVATVQGIVRGLPDVMVERVPSLMVTAFAASAYAKDRPVAALYDARRGDVYGAVYAVSGGRIATVLPPTLAPVSTLRELAEVVPALAVGDGATAHAADVLAWIGRASIPAPDGGPHGTALLRLADVPGATEAVAEPAAFVPAYGRPAEAQARWEERHGQPLPDSPGRYR